MTNAKFCMSCGQNLVINCNICNTNLPPEAKFCYSCGASLDKENEVKDHISQYIPKELLKRMKEAEKMGGLQNERRVVTILFCDLQGSTASAEQLDPEDWTDIMNGAFEFMIKPVYQYEGVLARLMGASILAFFGAPIAHEDDPERAILTAIDILSGIKSYLQQVKNKWGIFVNPRIGINTGLVVVGEIGSDMRVEYSAMGDAVNLASRMESTAVPGTIQISENTYKLVSPFFDLKSLGEISVKGKTNPVKTYQVMGKKEIRGALRGIEGFSSPLVGRTTELELLRNQIQTLISRKGGIISLSGDAGLGKSRLIHDLHEELVTNGYLIETITDLKKRPKENKVIWLSGRSLSYQANSPYAPIISMFARFFELNELNLETEKYDKIKKIFDYFEGCDEIAPYFANLFQIKIDEFDINKIQYLEPPFLKTKTLDALMLFFEVLSSTLPVVIVLDDLQWVDSSSFDFIKSLFELSHKGNLLIIGLYRHRRDSYAWEFQSLGAREYEHLYTRIDVKSLSQAETQDLVRNLLTVENVPEQILSIIQKQSDGNPFYVEEVIRSLIDSKSIIQKDGSWQIKEELVETTVPSTLVGVLTSRVDQLDEDSKRTAQIASVIGRIFRVDVLNDIYGRNLNLSKALIKLEKREMVEVMSRIPIRIYSFRHAMFHEIVYNSQLLKTRRELHKKIATSLTRITPNNYSEIARHYYEALDFENAFPYLIKSASVSSKSYSSNDSVQIYKKAKDIMDESKNDPNDIRDLFLGLGKHYVSRGQFSDAIDVFEELLEIGKKIKHPESQVSALNQLGYLSAMIVGDINASDKFLSESETISKDYGLELSLAECFMIKCNVETVTAKFDSLEDHLLEAIKIGERNDVTDMVLYGRTHVSNTLLYMTRFEEADDYISKSLELVKKNDNKVYLSELKSFSYALSQIIRGNIYTAHNSASEGMQLAVEIGHAIAQLNAGIILTQTNLYLGRFAESRRMIELTSKIASAIGVPGFMALIKSCLIDLRHEIGEKDENIESLFHEIDELMDGEMGRFMGGRIWITYGFHYLQEGNIDEAENYFHMAFSEPNTLMHLYEPLAKIGLGFVALTREDYKKAANIVKTVKTEAMEKNMRFLFPLAYQLIGDLADANNKAPECIKNYEKGEKEAEEMGMKPVLWKLKASIAKSYHKAGMIDQAEIKVKEARRIIEELSTNFTDPHERANYILFSESQLEFE